jgi:hypothetical protein
MEVDFEARQLLEQPELYELVIREPRFQVISNLEFLWSNRHLHVPENGEANLNDCSA